MALISGTVAVLSSFMQNIGAAALFLPATHRMCKQLNVPVSQVLIPMSYCAVIGGCITLVGSSPLILLNDLAASWWANNPAAVAGRPYAPFGLFSVAPIGISLVICAILYFIFLGKFILPKTHENDNACCLLDDDLECTYGREVSSVFELTVPEDFTPVDLRNWKFGPNTMLRWSVFPNAAAGTGSWYRAGQTSLSPKMWWALSAMRSMPERWQKRWGGHWRRTWINSTAFSPRITLALLRPLYPPIRTGGQDPSPVQIQEKTGPEPPGHVPQGRTDPGRHLRDQDSARRRLFIVRGMGKFHLAKPKKALSFTQDLQGEIMHPEKAITAIACLALALVLALGFKIQLSISLLAGAVSMVLTRVMNLDQAYQSVDWMTVFLLAGLIPLGLAFESTGAAGFLASAIADLTQGALTPVWLFLIIGCLTSFLTLVTSNIGATVLMIPLSMSMALESGADPRMAALLVAVAASNTFVLPTHQVNALVMRPGDIVSRILSGQDPA